MRIILSLVLSLVIGASAATASAGSLAREADINQGLFYVAVADKIRRECGRITPRFFAARAYLANLKENAAKRGYSEAEIDAYLDDRVEKAKMRERRDAYFVANGASPKNSQSLCNLGLREIENESQIGKLLKAK
jgi:hypothetical protein